MLCSSLSGCGVTANMPVLGTGDSGFESRHPDKDRLLTVKYRQINIDKDMDKVSGKLFTKNKEDFECMNCGSYVLGDGYTNHCPECLFSRHVDINPGDRLGDCKGLMKPLDIEGSTENYRILHSCIKCGYKKYNRLSANDSMDKVLEIISSKVNAL
jgi:hypothetical protein